LMGKLRSLTFGVNIERYVTVAAVLLICVCVYLILIYSSFIKSCEIYLFSYFHGYVYAHILCVEFHSVSSGVLV
jgi:hypothetical protein